MSMFTRDEYAQFYKEQYRRVLTYLINRWGIPKADAEDIAQAVFEDHIKAMKSWSREEHEREEAVKLLFYITNIRAATWVDSKISTLS